MWNERQRVWNQKSRFQRGMTFLLFFVIVIISSLGKTFSSQAEEMPEELRNLYALSAVLMDAESGRVLEA